MLSLYLCVLISKYISIHIYTINSFLQLLRNNDTKEVNKKVSDKNSKFCPLFSMAKKDYHTCMKEKCMMYIPGLEDISKGKRGLKK